MIRLERAEQLPAWFQLDKYRDCETFSAARWVSNLEIRSVILDCFKAMEEHRLPMEIFPHIHEWLPEVLATTRASPIEAGACRQAMPIRSLIFQDLAWRSLHDKDDVFRSDLWNRVASADCGNPALETRVDTITNIFDSAYPVMVDLRASDSVLIEAFSDWLKTARAERPSSKRERPAYKDWARYGLLPYLDLFIWAKETGTQIPHHLMAEAVGYRKGGDSFRKTIPKLAAELMSSLAELEALAAIEQRQEQLTVRVFPEQMDG